MATYYAPLVLPAQLHDMPQYYQSKIPQFYATIHYTTQQHINKMTYYFELHEIDEADVQVRIFS